MTSNLINYSSKITFFLSSSCHKLNRKTYYKSGYSVKYMDAFRTALTEGAKLLIKQKHS